MNIRKGRSALIAGAVSALVLVTAVPANAVAVSDPILDGLSLPLGLAVGSDGTVYVTQSDFSGTTPGSVTELRKGNVSVIAEAGFVTGVEANGRGTTSFLADAELKVVNPSGKIKTLANLFEYEAANNPDADNDYGLQGITPECEADVLATDDQDLIDALLPHNGVVDANPYAVAILPNGDRVVADAGGNSLIRVTPSGQLSTLAVLPPRPAVINAETADALEVPNCKDLTMNYDFVPTDVELGPNGMLYVSSLPGGLEGPSPLGPRGGVFTVNPSTGALAQVGDGFYGATDLAVDQQGDVYVTELYSNTVSVLSDGGPEPIATLDEPVAIEAYKGQLYVSAGVFGPGQVVVIAP